MNSASQTSYIFFLQISRAACRFTYLHLLFHTLNPQLLLFHRHMQTLLHPVINTNISTHLYWKTNTIILCPYFSTNIQPPNIHSHHYAHIHSHIHEVKSNPDCQVWSHIPQCPIPLRELTDHFTKVSSPAD